MSNKITSHFDESKIETILGTDIDCKGKLKFSNSLIVKGRFEGDIETDDGHLYVGNNAEVIANTLKSGVISNKGKIFGNAEAKIRVEQFKGSLLEGDIVTPDLYIESGSLFNGHCTMINPE